MVSALTMGRADHEPESARRLLRWGWGLAIAAVVLGVGLIVTVVAVAVTSQPR